MESGESREQLAPVLFVWMRRKKGWRRPSLHLPLAASKFLTYRPLYQNKRHGPTPTNRGSHVSRRASSGQAAALRDVTVVHLPFDSPSRPVPPVFHRPSTSTPINSAPASAAARCCPIHALLVPLYYPRFRESEHRECETLKFPSLESRSLGSLLKISSALDIHAPNLVSAPGARVLGASRSIE